MAQRRPTDRKPRRWAGRAYILVRVTKRSHGAPEGPIAATPSSGWSGRYRPFLGHAEAPQRILCERIEQRLSELFVFATALRVPSNNNAAKPSTRPLVASRKLTGDT